MPDCNANQKLIELIYPKKLSSIYIPKDLFGQKQEIIFEAAHANTDAELFWHIDGKFIAATKVQHRIPLQPNIGKHQLLITDQAGNELKRNFEVVK